MSRIPLPFLALVVAAAGCAGPGAHTEAPPVVTSTGVLRATELARVRCLLVAPFENASDAPLAADVATAALVSRVNPGRARVFPVADLRALFRETALELPQGIAPSLALELAELVGADAALYGAVEGRSTGPDPDLVVTVRLALSGDRHLLFAGSAPVRPAAGEGLDAAVKRTTQELARPMLVRIGDPGRKRCFDAERTKALRRFALAEPKPGGPGAAQPEKEPATAAAPAVEVSAASAAPRPAAHTPRQAEWARRLAAGERIVVDDVAFSGRTARLQRDGGLADLAIAIGAARDAKVRLEAFVDATSNPKSDAKLSSQMARAAGERLVQLGVDRARLEWAGRGGESPLLPNFTVRGRAANRRLEVVGGR
jgi:outer membrane protein OmpA-like peptidoglycan-associated protein